MNVAKLKAFLGWCVILNGALVLLSITAFLLMPDSIYDIHHRLFSISRESFDVIVYSFIGLIKTSWLVFNVVPFVALAMVQKRGDA